jgi:N-acetylmuramoyl-L-alanine amidase
LRKRVIALSVILVALAVLYRGPTFAQDYRTISWGSSGGDVSEAQAILQGWGYYTGIVDGYFGAATSAAVRWFQRTNGLTEDGVIGPATWAALGISVTPPSVPAQGAAASNEHNVDLLARLIRAEAEAEPYEGKVAVAAVMLNRTRDSRFPKTLEGVVFETDAFESVSNGRIYDTPPTDDDYRAARDALNGWDPSYGCVFFWNPATATSPWIWSRPILSQIGSHVFAK